ncbi:MAG: TonB-dependent receptor plug domain-containing protein, partial [Acidobacteria bacterium]|nr:TonB-dependent receptor plug domain-containing protein [Acidobacteriota bacterium]
MAATFVGRPGPRTCSGSHRRPHATSTSRWRGATSTLSTSQLALVDGRSLYLDFFGFVAWDLLPLNPNEIRQIEVIRGPASAMWGANALDGVINFISKTPRELDGNGAAISFGPFDRSVNGLDADAGTMFSVNGTHARAVNDRWAYKLSAGGYTSDAFARPTGLIPGTQTPYPSFVNQGTTQPKFDTRVDYDAPEGRYKLVFAGGYAGTDGIIHTGIGPFDMDGGVGLGYATMRYSRKALRLNFFTNQLNGDATALLSFGPNGLPIPFGFNTKTYDFELGNVNTLGSRQVVSYGGNARYCKLALYRPAARSHGIGRRPPLPDHVVPIASVGQSINVLALSSSWLVWHAAQQVARRFRHHRGLACGQRLTEVAASVGR